MKRRFTDWLGYSQIVTVLIIGAVWANMNSDLFGPFTYQGPDWAYWPDVIATNLLCFYVGRLIFAGRAAMMGLITVEGREFHLTGGGKEGGVATVNIRAVDQTIVSDTHPNDCKCDAVPKINRDPPVYDQFADMPRIPKDHPARKNKGNERGFDPRPIKLFEAVLLEIERSHIDYHAPISAANIANWIVENHKAYGMAFVQPMSINGAISGMTIFSNTRPWVRCVDPTQPQDERMWLLSDEGHEQVAIIKAKIRMGEITPQ